MTTTTRTTTFLVEGCTQRAPLRARSAPSLKGEVVSVLKCAIRIYRQRGRLFLSEGRLRWRERSRIRFKGRRHERKGRFFRARKAALRRKGRSVCLEWRSHVRKGHLFVTEGRTLGLLAVFFFWVVRPPFLLSWKETNYPFRFCNGRNRSKGPNLKKTEERLCWGEGAPNLLRKAPLGAKSAIFMPE